jgi:ribulose-5-phosphate 4-epimerase/fuculose-1-phosphate aldolase
MEIRKITFNIYADSDEEAERGRKAIVQFINIMGQHGAMVSGNKLHEAVSRLSENPFINSQIIKFFKQ